VKFRLAGTGIYLPHNVVKSTAIDALAGLPAGTVEENLHITARHYAQGVETSSFMAAAAAESALADAAWKPASLDAIVGACGVMEQPIPGTAVLTQRRLGLGRSGIPAFDVNATCLSFLAALDQVLAGFALGRWRRVLIVSADIASAALDYSSTEASAIFGDGAAAVALESDGPHRLLASRMESYGAYADLCRLEAGGTRLRPHEDLQGFLAASRFRMEGPALFRATARAFPRFLARLLEAAGVAAEALNSIIPHQASAAALAHLAQSVGGDPARIVNIFRHCGNQIATSLPHALHVARREGRLATGSTSLLVGSSAGISLGGAVLRW
jgi:3-oxoacyl-[acyl-carrier-protein] synthase-3